MSPDKKKKKKIHVLKTRPLFIKWTGLLGCIVIYLETGRAL